MHPSVVLKVFIDGKEAAASPVMRIATQPWRFDVQIPPGSRIVSLATMVAGNGNQEDRANWVRCGFVRVGQYYAGEGDVEYLQLLEIARRMSRPIPNSRTSPCSHARLERVGRRADLEAWWIQNSYGPTYCALPF